MLWRLPEMIVPRALVFRPLVKGNEALETRLTLTLNKVRTFYVLLFISRLYFGNWKILMTTTGVTCKTFYLYSLQKIFVNLNLCNFALSQTCWFEILSKILTTEVAFVEANKIILAFKICCASIINGRSAWMRSSSSLWTQKYNKYLANLVFSVCTVSYESSFFSAFTYGPFGPFGHRSDRKNSVCNLQYGRWTRLVRGNI